MKQMTNEEFVVQYRDWRSQWHPTEKMLESEVAYISALAELIDPDLPL